MIISIVRNKYLAVTVGPFGLGMYSLLNSFFSMFGLLSGAWLATGAMKYISEYRSKGENDAIERLLGFTAVSVLVLSSFSTVLFFVFYDFFKSNFLSPDVIFSYYALFAASFISTSLTTIFEAFFNGMMWIKKLIIRRVVVNVFNLVSLLILVYFFDLMGFFASILIGSIFGVFLYLRELKGGYKIKFQLSDFKDDLVKKVLNFGYVDVILGFSNLASNYLQRLIIISSLGLSAVGLYHAGTSLTSQLGIVGGSAMLYFRPKMSEELTNNERNKALNDYLRLVSLSNAFISCVFIMFGEFFLELLFSDKFTPISGIFYLFVIAQFISSLQIGYMYTVVGMANLFLHTIVTLIAAAILVVIPYLLIESTGLTSFGLALIFSAFAHLSINSSYLYFKEDIFINKKNFILLLQVIILIVLSVFFSESNLFIKGTFLLFLSIVLFANLTALERGRLYELFWVLIGKFR